MVLSKTKLNIIKIIIKKIYKTHTTYSLPVQCHVARDIKHFETSYNYN